MLQIPKILDTPEFLDAPLNYKMNEKIASSFIETENDSLILAACNMSHKAMMGLMTALSEWVFWRLNNHKDMSKSFLMTQAHWAGVIDKNYMLKWKYQPDYSIDIIATVLKVTFVSLEITRNKYIKGDKYIFSELPSMAKLVKHISPDKELFDYWLSETIKRAIKTFPKGYDYKKALNEYEPDLYDSSLEKPIPREFFFESDFVYEENAAKVILNDYLTKLDYESNIFLNSPKVMEEAGFTGTPYKYEPNK